MQEQYVIVGRETFRTSSHFVHTLNYRQIKHTKAFDCVDHNKLWKIIQEMGIPDHLTTSWEICMQVKKQQLELDME